MSAFEERLRAALLGFAIGDTLGATVEFMSPEEIKREIGVHRDITGGGWLDLKPGEITDDTQMTLCVASSLVACGGFDAADMAERLLAWLDTDPEDVGNACRSGLELYRETGLPERPESANQAGNGALMRILPFAIRYANDPVVMGRYALQHAHLTHNHELSDQACLRYLTMVVTALQGASKEQLKGYTSGNTWESGKYDGEAGGFVVETMNTVLHCFFTTSTFEDALVKCVNLGGDADTTGAILGGLAGAFYGLEAIPARWLDALDQSVYNELIELAEQLSVLK
jgi:ADP-ribosyl-[dinitrogen reductase] hydrolase